MATLCFVLHLSLVLLIFVNKQALSLSLGRVFEEEYDDADDYDDYEDYIAPTPRIVYSKQKKPLVKPQVKPPLRTKIVVKQKTEPTAYNTVPLGHAPIPMSPERAEAQQLVECLMDVRLLQQKLGGEPIEDAFADYDAPEDGLLLQPPQDDVSSEQNHIFPKFVKTSTKKLKKPAVKLKPSKFKRAAKKRKSKKPIYKKTKPKIPISNTEQAVSNEIDEELSMAQRQKEALEKCLELKEKLLRKLKSKESTTTTKPVTERTTTEPVTERTTTELVTTTTTELVTEPTTTELVTEPTTTTTELVTEPITTLLLTESSTTEPVTVKSKPSEQPEDEQLDDALIPQAPEAAEAGKLVNCIMDLHALKLKLKGEPVQQIIPDDFQTSKQENAKQENASVKKKKKPKSKKKKKPARKPKPPKTKRSTVKEILVTRNRMIRDSGDSVPMAERQTVALAECLKKREKLLQQLASKVTTTVTEPLTEATTTEEPTTTTEEAKTVESAEPVKAQIMRVPVKDCPNVVIISASLSNAQPQPKPKPKTTKKKPKPKPKPKPKKPKKPQTTVATTPPTTPTRPPTTRRRRTPPPRKEIWTKLECPTDYVWMWVSPGYCFKSSNGYFHSHRTKEWCAYERGWKPIVINSKQKNDALREYANDRFENNLDYWISPIDEKNGELIWRESGEKVTFTNFEGDVPEGPHPCLQINYKTLKWHDADCKTGIGYNMCERVF